MRNKSNRQIYLDEKYKTCLDCGAEIKKEESLDITGRYCSLKRYCQLCKSKRAEDYKSRQREASRLRSALRTLRNKESENQRKREYMRGIRRAVINAYGGKCACCGASEYEFLALDHINGGGRKERLKLSPYKLYRILIKNNFPQGEHQILCHNCNCAKGAYGTCPHLLEVPHAESYFTNRDRKIKRETVEAYGGKCFCCSESNPAFLTIDHIHRDGRLDRQNGLVGQKLYQHLRRNNYPKERYRVLCYNCNLARGFYGLCPHLAA